jgi:hypothetical protein
MSLVSELSERLKDPALAEQRDRIQRMSVWLDFAVMVGTTLTRAQDGEVSYEDYDFSDLQEALNENVPEGLTVECRGQGFTWAHDDEGKPITVYQGKDQPVVGAGEVVGVDIMDPNQFDHICAGVNRDFDGEENDSWHAETDVVDPDDCQCEELSALPQLYVVVQMAMEEDEDGAIPVAGACVRAEVVRYYTCFLATGATFEIVTPIDEDQESCLEDDVKSFMQSASEDVWDLLHDESFRLQSPENQREQIRGLVDDANKLLRLGRFEATTSFDEYYERTPSDGDHAEARWETAQVQSDPTVCFVKLLGVDSLDLYSEPRREIRNDDDLASEDTGLFLIVEINDYTKEELGAPSNILWLPIKPWQDINSSLELTAGIEPEGLGIELYPVSPNSPVNYGTL